MIRTQRNLLRAFTGESIARNKYTQFAHLARKEGWEWVARIFEETAENERAHAQELFELITEKVAAAGDLILAPFGNTLANLRMAAEGEKYEWSIMYPDFENQAEEDKDAEAQTLFSKLKEVENHHEERYNIIADQMENGTLYNQPTEIEWKCSNCGYIHKGKQPPEKCPLCQKDFKWYQPLGLVK